VTHDATIIVGGLFIGGVSFVAGYVTGFLCCCHKGRW